MKKYLRVALLVMVIGFLLGIVVIKNKPTKTVAPTSSRPEESKRIFGQDEVIFDETSLPQVSKDEKEPEEETLEKTGLKLTTIKNNNNEFQFLLSNNCLSSEESIIECTGDKNFVINTNPSADLLPTKFEESQNFPAGDYIVTINTAGTTTVFDIDDQSGTIVKTLVTGQRFEDIALELMSIIATFSKPPQEI